jgi:aryl-alcohol dehydrogenase-like predicted oxidoreductase
MTSTRRRFLKDSASAAIGIAVAAAGTEVRAQTSDAGDAPAADAVTPLATPPSVRKGDMLYRTLGRTGEQVSLLGLGGYHVGTQADEQESIRIVRSAIDRGVTFLDNSWDYNGGQSEIRMGKALQNGYRQRVFLMTKIDGRSKQEAARQLDESLGRLQVDHLDLIQFHEVVRPGDPDRIFAVGGAIEAVLEAKQVGKVRFIGFTGHKDPSIHLRMLELARQHGFRPDTVQMPVNVMDAHFRSFTHQVLPVLVREQIGALAMKTFAGGVLANQSVSSGVPRPIEMLHYSMSQPVSVVITGMDRPEILDQALEAVRTFEPMKPDAVAALLARTRPLGVNGGYERFKVSHDFDSTFYQPQWFDG